MDRGVKIAIFVASIASLGLGLIWDQVLSHARVMVEESAQDELGPEVIGASMGSPDLERMLPPDELSPSFEVKPVEEPVVPTAEAPDVAAPQFTEYTVKQNDSPWKICHEVFADRDIEVADLVMANPSVDFNKLKPGMKLLVPGSSQDARRVSTKPESKPETPSSANDSEWIDYTVQPNDNWWTLANRAFRTRGHGSDALQEANPDVKELRPGQKIKIPPAGWKG